MVKFTELPAEMVYAVLTHLDKGSLAAVSITTRYLHDLVEPILYGSITIENFEENRQDLSLLRSCLHRPKLFSYLRRLKFIPSLRDERPIKAQKTSREELQLATNAFLQAVPDGSDHWIRALKLYAGHDSPEPSSLGPRYVAMLMVAHSRNLESLSVTHCGAMHIVSPLIPDSIALQSIKSMRLQGFIRIDVFLFLLYLPNLQSLSVSLTEEHKTIDWCQDHPIGSSITHLKLLESSLKEPNLKELLKCTPKLKALTYEFQCEIYPNDHSEYLLVSDSSKLLISSIGCTHLRCGELMFALPNVSKTLEHLTITVEFISRDNYFSGASAGHWGITGKGCDLRKFEKLAHVEIPFELLLPYCACGWPDPTPAISDFAPPNLVYMWLRDDLWYLDTYEWTTACKAKKIEEWLMGKSSRPAHLKCLNLSTPLDTVSVESSMAIELIEDTCRTAGVVFQVSMHEPLY